MSLRRFYGALMRYFCASIKKLENAKVLVGGLGMGFTHADNDSLYSIKSLRAIKCGLKWLEHIRGGGVGILFIWGLSEAVAAKECANESYLNQ